MSPDAPCTDHPDVDWLFSPTGPRDPAWIARIRAEVAREPVLVKHPPQQRNGWTGVHKCCRVCGTTGSRNYGHGRCNACNRHWRKHGTERPMVYWRKEQAS